jgi:prepilin-type N-terminal cleavage/methylation domain-containing protein
MSSFLKKAFTLIELLVVIAIIGILSGLIVVSMNGMTRQASVAKAQVFNNTMRSSMLADLDIDIPLDSSYNDIWSNNTGTGVGATLATQTSTNCVQSTCYSFNGGVGGSATTDYITLPDHSNYTMTTQMTAMVWVKGNSQVGHVPFAHWDATGTGTLRGEWEIAAGTGGALRVVVSNDGTSTTLAKDYITSAAIPFDGNWHLVGFTFAPGSTTGTLSLYVDGVVATATQTLNGNVPTIYGSTAVLSLGCSVTGASCTSGTYFAGLIDEARVYDVTIPTSQIKELYYSGLTNLLKTGQISSTEYSERVSAISLNN